MGDLQTSVQNSARALEGASFALAHTLRPVASAPNASQVIIGTMHEAEAMSISCRAVLDEGSEMIALLSDDSKCVGHLPGEVYPGCPVRNGFDSLAFILVILMDRATAAVLEVAGNQSRWLMAPMQANACFERMQTHHGQLKAMYGLVHLATKVIHHANVSQTLFVDVTSAHAETDLDPMKWRAAIKMDDFYGRYFGFHYAPEVRNVLRVVNIARGSVDQAHKDTSVNVSPLVKNVTMLGWGWIYSNIVLMNNLGLNIEAASKIGADSGRPSIEALRTFMNLVEDPLVAGVTGLASADVAIDKAFSIPPPGIFDSLREMRKGIESNSRVNVSSGKKPIDYGLLATVFLNIMEPVCARLMSFRKRPADLSSLTPLGSKRDDTKARRQHKGRPCAPEARVAAAPLKATEFPQPPHDVLSSRGLLSVVADDSDPIEPESNPSERKPVRTASRAVDENPRKSLLVAESSVLATTLKAEFSKLQSNVTSFLGLAAEQPASGLILHFHGGGFVSQSSLGHSVYLKEWCADMPDAVILSVDYKLAPEHRFPRALHECVYAYHWALENAEALGTLAERIVFTGDSAGGNLAVATALMANDIGLRRPDGICLAYPSLYVSMAWSPSRLLSFFDPLLPLSVMELCMTSYLPVDEHRRNGGSKDPYISPVVATDLQLKALPPVTVVCGSLDPLLDDAVLLSHRLKKLRDGDLLRVYESMPHGFLNMIQVSDLARNAMQFLGSHMATYLDVVFREGKQQPGEQKIQDAGVSESGANPDQRQVSTNECRKA